MLKSCLVEVEAFPENEPGRFNRRHAFVRVYLRELNLANAHQTLTEACKFMGFKLVKVGKIEEVNDEDLPPEGRAIFASQGFGFGTLYTFPN